MAAVRNMVLLGCTGSIGDTTFEVLEHLKPAYRVVGLSGGAQVRKLVERARAWKPSVVCVADSGRVEEVRCALPGTQVVAGAEGLLLLAALEEAELVVNALVGAVGLEPTLAAVEAGKVVAMANKEPLVMAGELILRRARECAAEILPLDSEPNALWQCLEGRTAQEVRRLILTASGGAFRGWNRAQMRGVTPAQALDHPTWNMGPKVTVDAATLMNKGFEVIEASRLFELGIEHIEVVIHHQSVLHSMVEFVDGAVLAHLGRTDMLLPIQYALTHPHRRPAPLEALDLAALGSLSFAAPDRENFPCLELCYRAGRMGGTAPAVLNAANEVAVDRFLHAEIGFLDIAALNRHVLEACRPQPAETLGAVLRADAWGRSRAAEWQPAEVPVP